MNPFSEGHDTQILVSPQRMSRPWSGQLEHPEEEELPAYDAACPLCPGNARQDGKENPVYTGTYVFPNDNPTLLDVAPDILSEAGDAAESLLFQQRGVRGASEVVVFTPEHNKVIKNMTTSEIESVIREIWISRYVAMGNLPYVNYVGQFETRGKELGNSAPHPHGQIWGSENIPPRIATEIRKQRELTEQLGRNAMLAYIEMEIDKCDRLVYANDSFGLVVPWWANWPYETMLIPRQPVSAIDQFSNAQIRDLAHALSVVTNAYATVFERPTYGAPYMMGIQQAPTDGGDYSGFQMHIDFKTSLLQPMRQKFPAGYEQNFGYQRDLTPEAAALTLKRAVPNH